MSKRHFILLASLVLLTGGLWFVTRFIPTLEDAEDLAELPMVASSSALTKSLGSTPAVKVQKMESVGAGNSAAGAPQYTPEEEAKMRAVDAQHMQLLRTGIFAFKKKYGHYPEYLSQLVPEFVTADVLSSPRKSGNARDHADLDHSDPGKEKPSYGYEFSNLEFRDGRTFAEIKEIQRAEWGDAVPILRCFAYGQDVMNLSYGGQVYQTALNWEWDPATMDVVAKHGWGPGLKVGEMVKVRVTSASGAPVPNAQVWADGRTYSFSLPNRPYTTDAEGYASIPVGSDLDRTALRLRATASNDVSPIQAYPLGSVPQTASLVVEPGVQIGGTAQTGDGSLAKDAYVYLRENSGKPSDGHMMNPTNIATVKTDAQGSWSAVVHPTQLANLSGTVATSSTYFSSGNPIPATAAQSGQAVVK